MWGAKGAGCCHPPRFPHCLLPGNRSSFFPFLLLFLSISHKTSCSLSEKCGKRRRREWKKCSEKSWGESPLRTNMPECIDKDLLSLNIKYKAKGLSSHNFKYGAYNYVSCLWNHHLDFCHVKPRGSIYQPILTWSYYASADVTHFYPAKQSHLFFIKQFDRDCPTESVCLCIFPTPRLSLANMHKGLLHWAYISATSKHKQNKGLHKRASEDIWRPNFVG